VALTAPPEGRDDVDEGDAGFREPRGETAVPPGGHVNESWRRSEARGARRRTEPFTLDTRFSFGYHLARAVFMFVTGAWFRPVVKGRERVPQEGPVIIAPVHRSFADFGFAGFLTDRKLFFMVKDELWSNRALGKLIVFLGGFPVHRGAADREALRRAQEVLERGQMLVLFPEGTRHEGPRVEHLHEGAVFLAARTGAPIVPVGIGGSDVSMPKGKLVPRPLRIHVVVGEPVAPPAPSATGRIPRSALREATERLRVAIQAAYDEARADFDSV
jgi:1-acyl-sn-glycerol-3-phosphate acyltransferase